MNIDRILAGLNAHDVRYMLIGGVNFLLRHEPVLTYDVDIWVEDNAGNLARCEAALAELDAEWGETDERWGPVGSKQGGWLASQGVFCLTSPHGAIDVFRSVQGLGSWRESRERAVEDRTGSGVPYLGLGDKDMLVCQEALPDAERKQDRVRALREWLERDGDRDG